MQHESFHAMGLVLCLIVLCTATGRTAGSAQAEEIEILKITVGEPTKLTDQVNQNTASLAVSRTGTIAAFYPKPPKGTAHRGPTYLLRFSLGRPGSSARSGMDAAGVSMRFLGRNRGTCPRAAMPKILMRILQGTLTIGNR